MSNHREGMFCKRCKKWVTVTTDVQVGPDGEFIVTYSCKKCHQTLKRQK